jgi:hypothetical protein
MTAQQLTVDSSAAQSGSRTADDIHAGCHFLQDEQVTDQKKLCVQLGVLLPRRKDLSSFEEGLPACRDGFLGEIFEDVVLHDSFSPTGQAIAWRKNSYLDVCMHK